MGQPGRTRGLIRSRGGRTLRPTPTPTPATAAFRAAPVRGRHRPIRTAGRQSPCRHPDVPACSPRNVTRPAQAPAAPKHSSESMTAMKPAASVREKREHAAATQRFVLDRALIRARRHGVARPEEFDGRHGFLRDSQVDRLRPLGNPQHTVLPPEVESGVGRCRRGTRAYAAGAVEDVGPARQEPRGDDQPGPVTHQEHRGLAPARPSGLPHPSSVRDLPRGAPR